MNEPGMWRTAEGVTMRIADMEDRHLRNSMRSYYRKLQQIRNGNCSTAISYFVPTEWQKLFPAWSTNFTTKFTELCAEATARNWFPVGTDTETIYNVVAVWEQEAQIAIARWKDAHPKHVMAYPPSNTNVSRDITYKDYDDYDIVPKTIGIYLDVASTVCEVINSHRDKKKKLKVERRLSFDL